MGQLQSLVISEVVALVALPSGIALSPEDTVRYGRHRRKAVIWLGSPSFILLVLGLPLLPLLPSFALGLSYSQPSFYEAPPATPSSGSRLHSDRLASSAVAVCAVAGVGCRGFRPATSAPDRAWSFTGRCSGRPTVSSSFLQHLKVTRLWISHWGYC